MRHIVPARENSMCGAEDQTAEWASGHCASWTFRSFLWPFPETLLSSSMSLWAPWSPKQDKELLSDQLSYKERMIPRFFMHPAQSFLLYSYTVLPTYSQPCILQ